jgi:hypothetical protein
MPPSIENRTPRTGKDSTGRRALRIILGVITGLIVWAVVVTVCDIALRKLWVEYALVEKSLAFTLPMMLARLLESAVSSVVSGFAAALVSKERIKSSLIAGVLILAMFLPTHISIWHKFPVWYHLTFLMSLPLLSLAGGLLRRPATTSRSVIRAEA